MGKSTYLSNKVLDHVLGGSAYTAPSTAYLALFTDMTGVEESGTLTNEVSGGGYVRKALPAMDAAVGGEVTLDSDLFFDVATGDWGTVVGFAVMDASTGGNVLYAGNLTTSRTYYTGDTPYIPAGTLVVSET